MVDATLLQLDHQVHCRRALSSLLVRIHDRNYRPTGSRVVARKCKDSSSDCASRRMTSTYAPLAFILGSGAAGRGSCAVGRLTLASVGVATSDCSWNNSRSRSTDSERIVSGVT